MPHLRGTEPEFVCRAYRICIARLVGDHCIGDPCCRKTVISLHLWRYLIAKAFLKVPNVLEALSMLTIGACTCLSGLVTDQSYAVQSIPIRSQTQHRESSLLWHLNVLRHRRDTFSQWCRFPLTLMCVFVSRLGAFRSCTPLDAACPTSVSRSGKQQCDRHARRAANALCCGGQEPPR